MFAETVLKIEGDDVTVVESFCHLDEMRDTITMRKQDGFLLHSTSMEKQSLIRNGYDCDELLQ